MNHRLLIPAIALVSFAAAMTLMSGRDRLSSAAPPTAVPPAQVAIAPSGSSLAPPAPVTGRQTERAVTEPVEAPPDDAAAPPPAAARPADPDEFLAAQDRAAAHSSRSR